MASAGHLFVSYSTLEAGVALGLAAELRNLGVRLWMDRLDGIRTSDDWRGEIEEALKAAGGLLALLSPRFVQSRYCRQEMSLAESLGLPIFPVLLAELKPEEWPLAVQGLHYADLRDPSPESYARRVCALADDVRLRAPAHVGEIPDHEVQYLNRVVAELESHEGVAEFVSLAASAEAGEREAFRPEPPRWKVRAPEFSLLLPASDVAPPAKARERRWVPVAGIHEAVTQAPRLVLVGEPGAGKTTTLRRLALDAARARLRDPSGTPLPFVLPLSAWSGDEAPADFVASRWPFAGSPLAGLARGEVQLFLDGLNEMGAKGPKKAALLRAWLQGPGGPARIVVTCREHDYTLELDLGLPTARVEPMNEPRVRRFAANYLGEAADAFLGQVFGVAGHELEGERSLRRLVGNPYFLSALVFVFQQSGDGALPRNVGSLFERLVLALWERERLRQTPGWVPPEQMREALAGLAFAMIDEKQPVAVSQAYADRHVAPELQRACRSASLLQDQGDSVRFYHQLMQEYFAAVRLARLGIQTRLKGNPSEAATTARSVVHNLFKRSFWKLAKLALTDPLFSAIEVPADLDTRAWEEHEEARRWDEVVVAMSGLVPNADEVVHHLLKQKHYALAGRCIASAARVSADTKKAAVERLVQALRGSGDDRREEAAEALGHIGDPAAVPALVDALDHGKSSGPQEAIADALGRIGGEEVVHRLMVILKGGSGPKWGGAAEVLGRMRHAPAVPLLLEGLRRGPSQDGWWAIVHALGSIGGEQAVAGLKEAVADPAFTDRSGAADALAKLLGRDALPLLRAVLWDQRLDKRWGAASALGQLGDAAVPDLIAALDDGDEGVRRTAAWALGKIGNPAAIPALEARLVDVSPDWVSWGGDDPSAAAATALERIGTEEARRALASWPARLLALLDEGDPALRRALLRKLADLRSSAAVPRLTQLLRTTGGGEEEAELRDEAARALRRIGTPEAREAIRGWSFE